MLHLKLAEVSDLSTVERMFYKLYSQSVYFGVVDWDQVSTHATLKALIENGISESGIALLYKEDQPIGAIAFSNSPALFNRQKKMAVEIGFYIEPEHRNVQSLRKLVGAYRYWAKKTGCHAILMGKLKNNNEVETYTVRKLG